VATSTVTLIHSLTSPRFHRDEILIGGSTTALQYSQLLAEEYMKQNNSVKIICEGGGSTPGLIAVKNGSIDIASTSRDLTSDEDDEYTDSYLIGKDSVGIIVNPSNPINDLTMSQVKDIFSGETHDWSAVGGTKGTIRVISRSAESTTLKGLNELVMKGEQIAESAIISNSAQELSEDVARNPDAIGFVALKDIKSNVKTVKIDGIEMNKSTILTERYPITRAFYYVIYDKPDFKTLKTDKTFWEKVKEVFARNDENSLKANNQAILSFLEFARSAQGQRILEDNGAIAVY
jgi:phosphate transport system substrate-binding protein